MEVASLPDHQVHLKSKLWYQKHNVSDTDRKIEGTVNASTQVRRLAFCSSEPFIKIGLITFKVRM